MEKKWNKPKGFFTNMALGKGENIPDEERTYFQRMRWPLQDGSTIFDLNTMDGEMGYYVCLASSKVANSEKELRDHKWPKAEFYIALENESDELKHSRIKIKQKAFAILEAEDMTDSYKRKFTDILGITRTTDNATTQQIDNTLFEYVDKSTFTPGSNIEKLNELYKLMSTAHGRDEIAARHLLKQALDNRIIYDRSGTYKWIRPSGELVIGERYSEAIEFLLNPKKAPEVEELTEMIAAKTR